MVRIFVWTLAGWLLGTFPIAASPGEPEAAPNPTVAEALDHLRNAEYRKAAKTCKQARGLEGQDLAMCSLVLAISCNQTGDAAGAVEAAQRVIDLVDDRSARRRAFAELGIAHAAIARSRSASWPVVTPGPTARGHLESAEQALRSALALGSEDALRIRFQLAHVLIAKMLFEKDWRGYAEIQTILEQYLEEAPSGEHRRWAESMLCRDFNFDFEPLDFEPSQVTFPVPEEMIDTTVLAPEKISARPPQYTELARLARVQGTVILQAIIDTDGRVRGITPLQRLPLCLTEEAMKAVATWRFKPATQKGDPVPVYYNLSINFRIES